MKTILIAGTTIVNLALISYSIFIYNELKFRVINKKVLLFLTTGIILDITATACMIIGSSKGPFTFHGILGYTSLTGMLIDTLLIWVNFKRIGTDKKIHTGLHLYSLVAYLWWIAAYIAGAVMVMAR